MIEPETPESPQVVRLAPEAAGVLVALDAVTIPGIAVKWAQTEEFVGASPHELADVLEKLNGLALRAQSSGRRLYCWISL